MKIRTQLLLMATAVLLPVVLAAGVALDRIREGERQAAMRGLRETVRATALIVDREIQSSVSALKVLGNSQNLDSGDMEAFYRQAATLNQLPDVWTILFDKNGQQVLNTNVPSGTAAPPATAVDKVRTVLQSQQILVSDVFVGPVSSKLVTTVYLPATAGAGNFVVAQAFSVGFWKNKALQRDLPPDWVVAVIDKQGRFISRSHNATELLGKAARPELVQAASASADGLIRHTAREGLDAYDAFAHSALTGWTVAVTAPVKSVEAAAERAMQLAMAGMLLAVAAALTAVMAFGRTFMRAIDGACRSAQALGRGHKPVTAATGIAEIDQLNLALLNAGSLLDVERRSRQSAEADREQLLQNETQAREEAEAQNVAKDQFLAMLGHELRNPLAAISGATALLNRGKTDAAMTSRCIGIINRQNDHLSRIVNDLLEISRLMAGKITIERVPVDLTDCVKRCIEALRTTERAAGYRINLDAAEVWVAGDAVRLDQILNNLVTNALKFSPPGAEVRVSVAEVDGKAVVTVRDHGTGISAELLPHVFEPFVQGPPSIYRAQSGLGIGLALVRQLVQLHLGEVEVASAGQGHGSAFSFRIPAIVAGAVSTHARGAATRPRGRLVYVEDNEDARLTMAELLRDMGYDVVEVPDGKGTLPAVRAALPDAVLMDIGLPDMNGYEVAKLLRAHPETASVHLVALTGYGQLRDKAAAIAAGFNAHLVKPVDPAQLVATIEGLVAGGPDQ